MYATAALSRVQSPASKPRHAFVSIIIPTVNEISNVRRQAQTLAPLPDAEVIFVDGGSSDGTLHELEACSRAHANLHVIHAPRRRSSQMNAAAHLAESEWLIFLHADTLLPAESFHYFIQRTRAARELNAGAFTFRVSNERRAYRY